MEAGRIQEVGGPERGADRVLDAEDGVVLPGFANGFARTFQHLLGPPRDLAPKTLAQRVGDLRERVTKRDVGVASLLALADMVRLGTTAVLDLSPWPDEVSRAVTQVGLRGLVAAEVGDPGDLKNARAHLRSRTWDRAVPAVGLRAALDPELAPEVAALAAEEDRPWCASVAAQRRDVHRFQRKTGQRPGDWLRAENLLSPRFLSVHDVWLTRNEIRGLAEAGAGAVHCPTVSSLAGGLTPLPELLTEGVPVALGTDALPAGGSWDPFALMRLTGLLHRKDRWDPTLLPAASLLNLATEGGRRTLGFSGGTLEAGQPADLAVLAPHPFRPPPSSPGEVPAYLVYQAEGALVRHVLVEGEAVVEDGRVQGVDMEDLRAEVVTLRRELDLADPGD